MRITFADGPLAGQSLTAAPGTTEVVAPAGPQFHRYRLDQGGAWRHAGPVNYLGPQSGSAALNKSASSLPSFHQIKER